MCTSAVALLCVLCASHARRVPRVDAELQYHPHHEVHQDPQKVKVKWVQPRADCRLRNPLDALAKLLGEVNPVVGWQAVSAVHRDDMTVLRRSPKPRPSRSRCACCAPSDESAWSAEEDWTLADRVPDFTAGRGRDTATFWTALVASDPILYWRSPQDCSKRMAWLAAEQNLSQAFGPEPPVLDAWSRLGDGRFTGTVDGRVVWLAVEQEARLASDPRSRAGYIETVAGRVYELGSPEDASATNSKASAAILADSSPSSENLERWGVLKGVVGKMQPFLQSGAALPMLFIATIFGGLSFAMGVQSAQPGGFSAWSSPQTAVVQQAVKPAAKAALQPAMQASTSTPRAEKVLITISEQKERQQIRLESDKLRLQNLLKMQSNLDETYSSRLDTLKDRLASDQKRMDNLPQRMETERDRIQNQLKADQQRMDNLAQRMETERDKIQNQLKADQERVDSLPQRLQVERDRIQNQIAQQELRIRTGQEKLTEIARVEAERGGGAAAVNVDLFPDQMVPTSQVADAAAGSGPPR